MICELLNLSPGHFSSGFCIRIMLMSRSEQLFAQMCHASLRMSCALQRLSATWLAEDSKNQPRRLIHANLASGS